MVFRANPDLLFLETLRGEGSEEGALKLDQPAPDLFTIGLTIKITFGYQNCMFLWALQIEFELNLFRKWDRQKAFEHVTQNRKKGVRDFELFCASLSTDKQ